MKFYRIKGITQKLMRSYLRGKYQRVILHGNRNKCCSEWKEICGVPQGSVLGTSVTYQKLYLIYKKPVLFADDTSILISYKDSTNFKIKINKLFDIINKWFIKNLFVINYKKHSFCSFELKIAKY
jgi:hypothetical protein